MTETFLAVPRGTASWILTKPAVLDALDALVSSDQIAFELKDKLLVEGALRLAGHSSGTLIAFWNADYLSGRPDEPWGFIELDAINGLQSSPSIRREVIERAVYVISQRLQGLLLDGAYIHRSHPDGIHTCLAGRGAQARQWSIAYSESDASRGAFAIHSVSVSGPAQRFEHLLGHARSLRGIAGPMTTMVLDCVSESRRNLPAHGPAVAAFRESMRSYSGAPAPGQVEGASLTLSRTDIDQKWIFRTAGWSYDRWTGADSPLTDVQKRILAAFPLDKYPVRISGPAGSGKTLLMQLLALKFLERGKLDGSPARIMYVAHNSSMATSVRHRFDILIGTNPKLSERASLLETKTLIEYGISSLGLEASDVIDRDAADSKEFQLDVLGDALASALRTNDEALGQGEAPFFALLGSRSEFIDAGLPLLMNEISTAIKGQGIAGDRQRYVLSEKPLSRLHGILGERDRQMVYEVFERYETVIRDTYGVLDADDVALSLLNKLQAPVWDLRRRSQGYDYVFVDETQLFNENERRVLPLLTTGLAAHVPIALSLDEAQDIHGHVYAGLATLGFKDLQNESLFAIQRSTNAIIQLGFFVIQQTTDLFSSDFPDFTTSAKSVLSDSHELARPPKAVLLMKKATTFGDFVVQLAANMRRTGCKSVGVICHTEQYWKPIQRSFRSGSLPYQELLKRGTKISDFEGITLSRPAYVGGQEFDGVIIVGLEQGTYPPPVAGNAALRAAVEQQSLRETYLSVSRARFQVVIPLNYGAQLNSILAAAREAGHVSLEFEK